MSLKPGTMLGPHEILALIGAGGMGEVYKARDTRLDRIVAIKVLPAHLAGRPELRERFEREARTVANLNHPHICVLYDIGQQEINGEDVAPAAGRPEEPPRRRRYETVHFLVMEYLEGETLAERLQKGPLALDQVLRYAIEIADALDKAHRNGVTHRDIKPANIMITKEGSKTLDFGLAKLKQEAVPADVPASQIPTAGLSLTAHGTIVGTVQYMAPEQVEGKTEEVDARTDIFSFGATLYEMATARKAFEGKSQASVMAAILALEPPSMASLQPPGKMTPPALDRVVRTCLAKDPDDRWQTARDLWHELKWIAEAGAAAKAVTAGTGAAKRRNVLRASLAGVVLGVGLSAAVFWTLLRTETPVVPSTKRFAVYLPRTDQVRDLGLALSPDGKTLVYVARHAGEEQLYRRSMDQLDVAPIPGTEGGRGPFFSPDGQWIGFFAGGKLKKVSVTGGPSAVLCDVATAFGGSWGPGDTIIFGDGTSGLWRVSAAGGIPEVLAKPESEIGLGYVWPNILPGGQAVLFTDRNSTGNKIAVQSLKTGQRRTLIDGTYPRFVSTGHIVFARSGSLWAVPFNPERLEVSGSPAPLVQGLLMALNSSAQYDVAADGSLVYLPGTVFAAKRLVSVDRKGVAQPLGVAPRPYEIPRLSPDGQRLAVVIREENPDVWTYDLARGSLTRLTFEPGEDETPVWTPDGKRLIFAGDRAGLRKLLSKPSDGSGTEEDLLATRGGHRHSAAISPDGQVLVYEENASSGTGWDIWSLALQGDRKAKPFLQTQFAEQAARLSPDGHWVAYMSGESGRTEVYVQVFPGPGGKWQISTEGGVEPVWARTGRELFYRNGEKMIAVDIQTAPGFNAGTPRVLFEGRYENLPWAANYDISPDGQRFLMIQTLETEISQIHVVLNWFEELKRKVPAGR